MEKKTKITDVKHLLFGKIPPNAKSIEDKVLGIMLLNPSSIAIVREVITEKDFYSEANTLICKSIFEISATTTPDLVLVSQDLINKGLLEEVGGAFAIAKLLDGVTSQTNLKQYCIAIKEKSIQRRLIDFGAHILNLAGDTTQDVFETIVEAENALKGINTELKDINNVSLAQIGMNVITKFGDTVYKAKNNILDENAIYTGLPEWDRINGALFPGLYIVAGRPGMGKGVHMTELICRMAKNYQIGVINGEMTNEQLMKRIGCNLMGIDNFLFKKNPQYVTDEEQNLLQEAMNEAINLKFHIDGNKNIHKISNKIRLWVQHYGVKCVLADFLTLFKVPYELQKYFTKTQEVDYILEVFVDLCKELNIPIILYVQMNREILGRHGVKEPNLADLKQSGSIEELAYQVCFLHRPEYYDKDSVTDEFGNDTKGLMYQIIAKHRDGAVNDRIKLKANLACSKLTEWNESAFSAIKDNSSLPF